MSGAIHFHEITDLEDDLLLPWLDLYEQAFPANEKVPVSDHLAALKKRGPGGAEDRFLLAALEESGNLVGMARYDVLREHPIAYLIYIAVTESKRGSGIGKNFYGEIVRRVQEQQPSVRGLVIEVERPDQAHSAEVREDAERRIRFYERQGASLLNGIRYLQEVPSQAPVLMHLMVHPFHAMSAEEAFELTSRLFTISRTQSQLRLG